MKLPRLLWIALAGFPALGLAVPAWAQGTNRTAQGSTTIAKDRAGPQRQRTIICRGAPIPSGWILANDMRDPSSCGGDNPAVLNAYNVWAIEKIEGRAPGTVIEVCASAPIPQGWVLVDVYRDRELCGHPDSPFVPNMKRIRKTG